MLLMTHFIVSTDRDSPARRLVDRAYRMRVFGFGLGFFCVASVLLQADAHLATWALLIGNAFVWPHIARFLSLRSEDPIIVETRNLLIDSAMGGVWVVLMQFNLLPSVLVALVLAVDKMKIGGWPLLFRGIAVQLAACIVAAAIHGLTFDTQTTTLNIVASLPLLIAYPLLMSVSAYSLMQTVRHQNRQLARLEQTGEDR
jgi:diguanylate cyclase